MNLKIYPVIRQARTIVEEDILFNTGMLTDVTANGTETDFTLRFKNLRKSFRINEQYSDVVSDVTNYNAGTKIQVQVVGIGNTDVNETMLISVDYLVYAWAVDGLTEILMADTPQPRVLKTYSSLASIEAKGQAAEGVGEVHLMTASQTTITTTSLIVGDNMKVFKNGSLQGLIKDLSDYTITGNYSIVYSGSTFYGGEEIMIIP